MSTDSLKLVTHFAAPPERLFRAWTNAAEHAAFTEAHATFEAHAGGMHTAWDDYIRGTVVEVDEPSRVVLTWRTTEFPEDAPDSRLELRFFAEGTGTRLEVVHDTIPAGQGVRYEKGWEEHYFAPLRAYLEGQA